MPAMAPAFHHWSRRQRERLLTGILLFFLLFCTIMCYFSSSRHGGHILIWSSVTGFWSLAFLVFSILCGVRFPLFEKLVGLDAMWSYHRQTSILCVVFAFIHVVLKLVDFNINSQRMTFEAMLRWTFLFSGKFEKIAHGRLALWVFMIITAFALFRRIPGGRFYHFIPWSVWMSVHFLLYPALICVFIHVFAEALCAAQFTPQDWSTCWIKPENKSPVFFILAVIMLALIAIGVLWRIFRTIRLFYEGPLTVSSVQLLSRDTTELTLTHPSGTLPSTLRMRSAGQFGIIRQPGCGMPCAFSSPHPLTFTDAPNQKSVRFFIRTTPQGKFTREVRSWPVGTRVFVEGAYGMFSPHLQSAQHPVYFIVGGCGFTPALSCLRQLYNWSQQDPEESTAVIPYPVPLVSLLHLSVPVTLILAVRGPEDLVFLPEMAEWTNRISSLRIALVLSNENAADCLRQSFDRDMLASFDIRQGFVSEQLLEEYLGDEHDRTRARVFLCGPTIMRRKVKRFLIGRCGLPLGNIMEEHFLM